MGTPNERIWPGVSQLPDFGSKFPNWKPKELPNSIIIYQDNFLDLFMQIMSLDPFKRVSAKNAMDHEFFKKVEPVTHVVLPSI